jgi:hypothetical protein
VLRQAYDWSSKAVASYLPEEIRTQVLALLSTEEELEEYLFEQLWCLREALRAGDIEACTRAGLEWNEGDPPQKLPPLQECWNWVDIQLYDIAQAIGCSDTEILAYVLANIRPTLSPVTIATRRYVHTLPGDTQPMQRTEVTITVRSRLTFVELRDLSRQLGQMLNVTKAKRLSAGDRKFLEVVEQIEGNQVGEGSKAFWEKVLLKWNGMEGVRPYTDWRNPRKRYTRLMERLNQVAV